MEKLCYYRINMSSREKLINQKEESWVVNKRPTFGPSQILDISELQVGKTVRRRSALDKDGRETVSLLIISEPFEKPGLKGALWIKVQNPSSKAISEISLGDAGVIPYPDQSGNLWNSHNWLEDPSKIETT